MSLLALLLLLVSAGVVVGFIAFLVSSVRPVWKLAAVIVVLLIVAAGLTAFHVLFLFRGVARVELVNAGSRPLTNLTAHLDDTEKNWWVNCPSLPPGRSHRIAAQTTDLTISEMSFTIDGKQVTWHGGGIAGNGERLVLSIDDNGTVTPSFGPWWTK